MIENPENNIAVITTGGTIGAAFAAGVTVLNHESTALRDHLRATSEKYGVKLHTFPAMNIFSEDMQPADWGIILGQIEDCLREGFTRIMVTHGTDTMEYAVTAAGLYFGARPARICFTGAFLPPSAPQSDAMLNIDATLAFLASDGMNPGVYVAFCQKADNVALIRAQDVMPMSADQTCFGGLYDETASLYAPTASGSPEAPLSFRKSREALLLAPGKAPTPQQLAAPQAEIIPVTCHPGMDLDLLRLDPNRPMLLILGAYHSGTVPTLVLREKLAALAHSHPKLKTVVAMHPARYITAPYETTTQLTKHGLLTIYRDIQPHQIYVLAMCESAKGASLEKILALLAPWRFDSEIALI